MKRLVVAVIIIAVVIGVYLGGRTESGSLSGSDDTSIDTGPNQKAGSTQALRARSDTQLSEETLSAAASDCLFLEGRGAAGDLALVRIRTETGANLYLLDSEGTQQLLSVTYLPNITRFAERSDGSVVVATGDIRKNSKAYRDPDSAEPLTVFLDGNPIYRSSKVHDFGVARDGSSFFVIEPTGAGTSRLVSRNLNLGTEHHFDLGSAWAAFNDELQYRASYDSDSSSIVIEPSNSASTEARRFFSVVDGTQKSVSLPSSLQPLDVRFLSPSDAVIVTSSGTDRVSVMRVNLGPDPDAAGAVWRAELDLPHFYGGVSASEDGMWIVLKGWRTEVIDTDSGTTAFSWPIAANEDEERSRLARTFPEYADPDVELGSVSGVAIRDGKLIMNRRFGMAAFESCHMDSDPAACIERAKASIRDVTDVYDMSAITVDASPDYRVESSGRFGCSPDGIRTGALLVQDEHVVYENAPGEPRP